MENVIWFQLLASLILGGIAAVIAHLRGRQRGLWFCLGLFFGPLGILALLLMPRVDPAQSVIEPLSVKSSPVHAALPPEFGTSKWFYVDLTTHQMKGPISFLELQALWHNRIVMEKSFVWCEHLEGWKRIAEIHGLQENLAKV